MMMLGAINTVPKLSEQNISGLQIDAIDRESETETHLCTVMLTTTDKWNTLFR